MRCPDCNKFTGMENGEPEIGSLEASYGANAINISGDATGYRNCADCGTQLKSLSMDFDATVLLTEMEQFRDLTPKKKESLIAALEKGEATLEVSDDGGSADESGGGRYAKNMITTTVNYTLTITAPDPDDDSKDITVEHNGSLENQAAASEYEEC